MADCVYGGYVFGRGCTMRLFILPLMITQFIGTIGSGKTYHALEELLEVLRKGGYVIANFPLFFTPNLVKRGYADRFLYIPPEMLEDESGIALFMKMSEEHEFDEFKKPCAVFLDEAGDIFPPHQATSDLQRTWKKFFKVSRHMGYDFTLIMQDETEINKTIAKCMEYKVVHRKANNIWPFKLLPFTLFMHITYWKQSRTKLKSGSTIFMKRVSALYNTHQYRNSVKLEKPDIDYTLYDVKLAFGNCHPEAERSSGGLGGQPVGGPQAAGATEARRQEHMQHFTERLREHIKQQEEEPHAEEDAS